MQRNNEETTQLERDAVISQGVYIKEYDAFYIAPIPEVTTNWFRNLIEDKITRKEIWKILNTIEALGEKNITTHSSIDDRRKNFHVVLQEFLIEQLKKYRMQFDVSDDTYSKLETKLMDEYELRETLIRCYDDKVRFGGTGIETTQLERDAILSKGRNAIVK